MNPAAEADRNPRPAPPLCFPTGLRIINSRTPCHSVRILLLLAFLALLFFQSVSPAPAKGPVKKTGKESSWIFENLSEEGGRGEVLVSAKGARIKLKTLTAIVTAPKFDAIVFDTSTKKYVELPYAEWSVKYKGRDPVRITPTGRNEKIAGLRASCYQVPTKRVVKEVWFTTEIPITEDMCNFITTTLHLPTGRGMPLRMDVIHHGKDKRRVFDTLKLVKSDGVDASAFQRPEGFKKVSSEYQLFVKEDRLKDMGGFLQ